MAGTSTNHQPPTTNHAKGSQLFDPQSKAIGPTDPRLGLRIPIIVLISVLIGARGPNREILKRCLQGKYRPLISNILFFEYEDTCNRKQILESCPLTDWEVRELLDAFYSVCHWVSIHYPWRPDSQDEGDNFLIELALAGNASAVVTNNVGDFRNMDLYFPGLRMVTPDQLLKMTTWG